MNMTARLKESYEWGCRITLPSARPFIIIPPIAPTSLSPLRFSTSFHFSPPFQPLTLFLEQKQREWREAAVEKWKRQGVTNSKRWRTQPIWINMRRFLYQVCANLLHPPLSPCLIFASPSLHLRSTLTPSWPDHGITLATSHLTPLHSHPPCFHPHLTTYQVLGLFTWFSASFFFVSGEGGRREAVEKRRGKA